MSTFTVFATLRFVPGTRDRLLGLLDAHRARSLEEPGTLQFEILEPRAEENTLYMYEVYADERAFAAHVNGVSFARVTKETADIITELVANRVTAIDMPGDAAAGQG